MRGSEAAQKAVSQLKEKLNDAKRELRVQKQVGRRLSGRSSQGWLPASLTREACLSFAICVPRGQVSKRAEQMAADLEAMTAQHNQVRPWTMGAEVTTTRGDGSERHTKVARGKHVAERFMFV